MNASICPFCGVANGGRHETQGLCIEALQLEIERMREMLDRRRENVLPSEGAPANGAAPADRKKATQPV